MQRVTISSSLKYKELIKQAISELDTVGVVGLFPNLDNDVKKEDVNVAFLKRLEAEHFEAIESSEGLYIICPDGYVGTLVSVEIGFARACNKTIIFSEKPEDRGLQAIASGYVSLKELGSLKDF